MSAKVVFCVPTVEKPFPQLLDSLERSVPILDEAGYDHNVVSEVGNPYISNARNTMLRKALDAQADIIVFLDHDLSWSPPDLNTLIETPGDVVAGTYRFRKDKEQYMGQVFSGENGTPLVREDGAIKAELVPAGFLKITKEGVNKFMGRYPELCFGPWFRLHVDLFNHGAHDMLWWGEDYAFSRRWREIDDLWIAPDLDLCHWSCEEGEYTSYKGNFHEFLKRQPGGQNACHLSAA